MKPERGLRGVICEAAVARDAVSARAILAAALEGKAESENRKVETQDAVAAFQRDMRPVCGAIVSALEAGDVEALKGLRALLPHLLAEVNKAPALADLLAHQLGKSLLEGLNAKPEDML